MNIKQIIAIRKDLRMRRGKEIAQGSHASMECLIAQLRKDITDTDSSSIAIDELFIRWIRNGAMKICIQVHSEAELLELYENALEHRLTSHLIRDRGKTEFDGVPTLTACAIGPDYADKIDAVTGKLPLY